MDNKLPPEKMAKLESIMKLKELAEELLEDDFKSKKAPKLMSIKVEKLDAKPLEEVEESEEDEIEDLTEESEEDEIEKLKRLMGKE